MRQWEMATRSAVPSRWTGHTENWDGLLGRNRPLALTSLHRRDQQTRGKTTQHIVAILWIPRRRCVLSEPTNPAQRTVHRNNTTSSMEVAVSLVVLPRAGLSSRSTESTQRNSSHDEERWSIAVSGSPSIIAGIIHGLSSWHTGAGAAVNLLPVEWGIGPAWQGQDEAVDAVLPQPAFPHVLDM
ncbi:hypothetical protein VTK73DRAFT_10309 [Phialemonium thermophilum]|uniref:Uncharacterized protein n=1 Tax=Phialemonium thermophilum TaxID=223376 RepID=A0ABR3VXE0_9PEZI